MKIDVRQIPEEGLTLFEEFNPGVLELDTETVKFLEPIKAKAAISKSYGAIGVVLSLSSAIKIICGRCLKEVKKDFKREIRLNYAVDKANPMIELDLDIREEIILDYSIKPLCSPGCNGLCPKCGANLNEGGCNCGTT